MPRRGNDIRAEYALRTQAEVAVLMQIDPRSVQQTEARAFQKIQQWIGRNGESRSTRKKSNRHPVNRDGFGYHELELDEWLALALYIERWGCREEAAELRAEAAQMKAVLEAAANEESNE